MSRAPRGGVLRRALRRVLLPFHRRFFPRLGPEDRAVLGEMLRDDSAAPEIYRPSRFWARILGEFEEVLRDEGVADFKVQYFNRRFAAYDPGDPHIYRALLWVYLQLLRPIDAMGLLGRIEAPLPGGGDFVELEHRRYTLDLLQSVDEFYSLREALGGDLDRPLRFAELGAGYGRLAHVVLHAVPRASYAVFDLPIPLFLAQRYLPRVVPSEVSILPYDRARTLSRIDRASIASPGLGFFAPAALERVEPGTFDVALNIYGLQEMRPDQVRNYLSLFSRVARGGVVYLKQHWVEKNVVDDVVLRESDYVLPSGRPLFHRPARLHSHVFESAARVTD